MQNEETCVSSPIAYTINDYVEGRLTAARHAAFSNYLNFDEKLRLFVRKSEMGRRALRKANKKIAAPDFREKLAQRIAEEKFEADK
jgi:anti-sigma factor RsiW